MNGGIRAVMQIAFKSKALRSLCLSVDAMDERYGAETGAALRRCLADLRAAETLADVPLLKMAPHVGPKERLRIAIAGRFSLQVGANRRHPPTNAAGTVDWPKVDRVLLDRIIESDA